MCIDYRRLLTHVLCLPPANVVGFLFLSTSKLMDTGSYLHFVRTARTTTSFITHLALTVNPFTANYSVAWTYSGLIYTKA